MVLLNFSGTIIHKIRYLTEKDMKSAVSISSVTFIFLVLLEGPKSGGAVANTNSWNYKTQVSKTVTSVCVKQLVLAVASFQIVPKCAVQTVV